MECITDYGVVPLWLCATGVSRLSNNLVIYFFKLHCVPGELPVDFLKQGYLAQPVGSLTCSAGSNFLGSKASSG